MDSSTMLHSVLCCHSALLHFKPTVAQYCGSALPSARADSGTAQARRSTAMAAAAQLSPSSLTYPLFHYLSFLWLISTTFLDSASLSWT